MTYCLGLVLDQGLVLASDSRTNAGIDYVTTFSKLHVFTPASDRIFVLLSAGNLATTQEVLNRIRRAAPLVDGSQLYLSARDMYFDGSKAERELGFVGGSAQAAVQEAWNWYRAHGLL